MLDPNGAYLTQAWRDHVYPLAAQIGLPMTKPPIQPRSRLAHEAAKWSGSKGRLAEYNLALFRAFFQFGRDIGDSLVLLVSCVGRKLVMGARVDEEVEAVQAVFGPKASIAGFYSNGEISPMRDLLTCHLHNQTMTVTHIAEASGS